MTESINYKTAVNDHLLNPSVIFYFFSYIRCTDHLDINNKTLDHFIPYAGGDMIRLLGMLTFLLLRLTHPI